MSRRYWIIAILFWLSSAPSYAGWVGLEGMGAGNINVHVTSLKEQRFRTTVRQHYDFSCGSAALATLLTFNYHHPVSEKTIFKAMYEKGDKNKIRREGFSMLDMKNYLTSIGYNANGYIAPLDKLSKAGIPAIVLIKDNGYNHFVLIKGIKKNQVLVGDPAMGTRIIPREKFEKMWTRRILFMIVGKHHPENFNSPQEWSVRANAPLTSAVYREELSNFALSRRAANDF